MTYTTTLTRDGNYWLATVTNLEGVSTWGSTFRECDAAVREAIALAEDLPDGAEDTIDVQWRIDPADKDVAEAVAVAELRKRLLKQQSDLEPYIRRAIATLTKNKWSTRDQAALFGMSAGRVSQITAQDTAYDYYQ